MRPARETKRGGECLSVCRARPGYRISWLVDAAVGPVIDKGTNVEYRLLGAVMMTALAACGQEPATAPVTDEARLPVSGISLEYMDTSVRPGDDFFSYVNGKWIAETEIPADKASYGGFGILRDEAQDDVKVIIEASATSGAGTHRCHQRP